MAEEQLRVAFATLRTGDEATKRMLLTALTRRVRRLTNAELRRAKAADRLELITTKHSNFSPVSRATPAHLSTCPPLHPQSFAPAILRHPPSHPHTGTPGQS